MRKAINTIDAIAYGVVLAGALSSVASGFMSEPKDRKEKDSRSTMITGAYAGLIGAASLYKMLRAMTLKTREERRMEQIAQYVDTAEGYRRRAQLYYRAADLFLKRRLSNFRRATSS